jgi:choline dehydrogenase
MIDVAIVEDGAKFDYVIVGAGSAGCVLANRLSADPSITVALLEAGGPDTSMLLRMPSGSGSMLPQKNPNNWGFDSAPQDNLGGRTTYQPRGRGWGGSSSINGMVYIRGHARDYDHWRQLGLTGWGYRDVLPYFRRAENNERFSDAYHGGDGPLAVSTPRQTSALFRAFVDAGAAAGHPVTDDFNGRQQEGVGLYQMTIGDGRRSSSSAAYLRPILSARKNLTVISDAHAMRVLIESAIARGVEYAPGPGQPAKTAFAAREVILAAGAFQSPQLLLLSGVGPAAGLAKAGVAAVVDSPDVGRNLQDHFDLGLVWDCPQPVTVYSQTKGMRRLLVGLQYMINRSGPARSNHIEAGAFLKTRKELDVPDIQLHFFDANFYDHARAQPDKDGFAVHVCQLRPESKGEVRLSSPDPFADPVIDPNYLATDNDKLTMRAAVKIVRGVVNQAPLDAFRGAEHRPGDRVVTDADIDAWVRATGETIYHPAGTCRMGADPNSVVDAELRVRGVKGLRVADASVMPSLVGGNTNAPAIMIGEKASDLILGRPAPAAEDAPIAEDAAIHAA